MGVPFVGLEVEVGQVVLLPGRLGVVGPRVVLGQHGQSLVEQAGQAVCGRYADGFRLRLSNRPGS